MEELTREDLQKLRRQFPRGYMNKMLRKTGRSITYIYEVLRGKRHDETVLQAALEMIEEAKQERQESIKRIKEAIHSNEQTNQPL